MKNSLYSKWQNRPELSLRNPVFSKILIFVIVIAGYWSVLSLHYTLQWDMLDCYLPWRSFAGECIGNGIFPYWCPYQNMGYPIHADLRSVWYPEIWIIGTFGGYSPATLHFLIVFYALLGAFGMRKFSFTLGCDSKSAFSAAVVYALSGYYVAHLQELSSMVSYAFIPYLVHSYIRLARKPTFKNSLITSLFLLLIITGGYQAHTIVLGYLLATLFVFYVVKKLRRKQKEAVRHFVLYNVVIILLIIGMTSMMLIGLRQSMPEMERLSGISIEAAESLSFAPSSFISLVLPFSAVKKTGLFDTNLTMRNFYVGLLFLVFVIISLFRRKTGLQIILLIFGALAFAVSMGNTLPFHSLAFEYLPLFNRFKPVAFLNYFLLLIILPLGAKAVIETAKNIERNRRLLFFISIILIAGLTITAFIFYEKTSLQSLSSEQLKLMFSFKKIKELNIFDHIFIQSVIQGIFCLLFVILLTAKKWFSKLIILLLILDAFLAFRLNMYYTGVDTNYTFARMNRFVQSQADGFPIPDNSKPVATFNDQSNVCRPLYSNTNTLTKHTAYNGMNSFQLDVYNILFEDNPVLAEKVLNQNLLYFSYNLLPYDSLKTDTSDSSIFTEDSIYRRYKMYSSLQKKDDSITISSFSPNRITAITSTESSSWLTLQQTDYKGWKVYVDGKEIPHITTNILTLSALIPPGNHTVTFEYENKPVFIAFCVAAAIFVFIISYLLVIYVERQKSRTARIMLISGVTILLLLTIIKIIINNTNGDIKYKKIEKAYKKMQKIMQKYTSDSVLCVTSTADEYFQRKQFPELKTENIRFYGRKGLKEFHSLVKYSDKKYLLFAALNAKVPNEIYPMIDFYYPKCVKKYDWDNHIIFLFSKENNEACKVLYSDSNEFTMQNETSSSENGFRLTKDNPYSPAFNIALQELIDDTEWIRISLSGQIACQTPDKTFLVIEQRINTIEKNWYALPVSTCIDEKNKFSPACFSEELKCKPEQILVSYLWLQSSDTAYVKNLRIKLKKTGK